MSWDTSSRRSGLPSNWHLIRDRVLRNAGWLCEIGYSCCAVEATEVDHINRGNNHQVSNLRAACKPCHARKSSAEGNSRRRQLKALRYRPTERHPGAR